MQADRKHKFTMKTKLPILLTVLFLAFSVAVASAQQPTINPATGLPEPSPNIDSATGLPADGSPPFKDSNGSPTWIDPAWPDSGKFLPSVDFSQLPLSEVARYLREQFTNYFDIILPNPNAQGVVDPTQIDIDLQLKNVTATEIFNAMNLQFELNKSPLRWELTLNGSRPTAIIRDLPGLASPEPPPPPQIRKVFYVGDMLDEYSGTNDLQKLNDISDTILNAWAATGIGGGTVNTYPSGQLLIVSGTSDQVDLAEQTVRALKDKAEYENSHPRQQPVNP